jgi:hypothetical protein
MKITELAKKKFGILFGEAYEKREKYFMDLFIYTNDLPTKGHGLTVDQLELFCTKCDCFGIHILGFETSYESEYGLHTVCFEVYYPKYKEGWWMSAIQYFKLNEIAKNIIPIVSIHKATLDFYLTDDGR